MAAFDKNDFDLSSTVDHFKMSLGKPFVKPGADLRRRTGFPRKAENHFSARGPSEIP